MFEQTKASKRRKLNPIFDTYFSGVGIDIGAGPDPVSPKVYQNVVAVRDWDLKDGDAQYLASVSDCTFDFVHSSHCLEHMVDPYIAFANWLRVCKVGGTVITTVPDENLYEHGQWPSKYNSDHKWSFTTLDSSQMPKSINVFKFLERFDNIEVKTTHLISDFYDSTKPFIDQTLGQAECAIEFIVTKTR